MNGIFCNDNFLTSDKYFYYDPWDNSEIIDRETFLISNLYAENFVKIIRPE